MNPAACMMNTAPISESGIATTGMMTERNDPRNKKMTTTTMINVSISVCNDFVDRVLNVRRRVVGNAELHSRRQLATQFRNQRANLLNDFERVRRGQYPDAHERRGLTVELDVGS